MLKWHLELFNVKVFHIRRLTKMLLLITKFDSLVCLISFSKIRNRKIQSVKKVLKWISTLNKNKMKKKKSRISKINSMNKKNLKLTKSWKQPFKKEMM